MAVDSQTLEERARRIARWAVGAQWDTPLKQDSHTVDECDAVLALRVASDHVSGKVTDAWLDERSSAMKAGRRGPDAA